jgi:ATP-dependent DNA helicase RecG
MIKLMNPTDQLITQFRLNPLQRRALERLGLETVADLIFYFPNRYGRALPPRTVAELKAGEEASVWGQVVAAKTSKAWKKKIPLGELTLEDQTGRVKAVWFHQAFLAKKVPVGQPARLSGKVAERNGEIYLANPEIEPATTAESETLFTPGETETVPLLPVYPETHGLSSTWCHHAIKKILKTGLAERLDDPLPEALLQKYHLPALATALIWIHAPKTEKNAETARKRFAFQEVLLIQLERLRAKHAYRAQGAESVATQEADLREFMSRFPFRPTPAQESAIAQIAKDLSRREPMTRLLEGDVGSGKTAVAAATAFAVVRARLDSARLAGFQVAYMVPTEILARQHFESFIKYFSHLPVQIGLITGAGCFKFPSKINPRGWTDISRPQLLKWVASGEIPILIGTHALIQKAVQFKKLAYVIIDEQHRFGVMQRARLARKNADRPAPHLLSMTATPIPRTLALTIYGDLDLSLLDQMPSGRKPVQTEIVTESERAAAYEHIRRELREGRQAYVICPRIDEPDPAKELALLTKSAKAEAKRLATEIFPDFSVGLVHSKLKPDDKEKVMKAFASGEIDLLVATSVVEVGVNVPNATIIIIEGAERFGLSQLHQLRGRVLRSEHQAHCYLFTSKGNPHEVARLRALKSAKNGFELAEMDLGLRGAGELSGTRQWGISDVGMEAIKNLKMVEAARLEAAALLSADPKLAAWPLLRERLEAQALAVHFE